MSDNTSENVLSSSSAWVAALLNIIPGLGTGYIYQRRWKAYWLTFSIVLISLFVTSYIKLSADPSDPFSSNDSNFNLFTLSVISIVSSIESVIACRNARNPI